MIWQVESAPEEYKEVKNRWNVSKIVLWMGSKTFQTRAPSDIALEFTGETTNNIKELVEEIQKKKGGRKSGNTDSSKL